MKSEARHWLVCGASSGIGLEIARQLASHENNFVWATHRSGSSLEKLKEVREQYPTRFEFVKWDALKEDDYTKLSEKILQLDGIINCVGLLHNEDGVFPERKIEELNTDDHLRVYQTNTLPTLLLAKHFKKSLRNSQNPLFAAVSAKVGSIEDNRMGGWHSYRISKAALNMAIKNLSIEFGRLNPKSLFVSIHPGTTETKLSEPFLAGAKKKYQVHSSESTARNILSVLESLKAPKDNGSFYSWNGEQLPW